MKVWSLMARAFESSYEGVGEMARSVWMEAEMLRRAERTKDIAEASAPESDEQVEGRPRYRDSFEVSSTRRGGAKGDRAEATVENTAPHARWVEYGRRPGPGGKGGFEGRHTLRNAAIAANNDET